MVKNVTKNYSDKYIHFMLDFKPHNICYGAQVLVRLDNQSVSKIHHIKMLMFYSMFSKCNSGQCFPITYSHNMSSFNFINCSSSLFIIHIITSTFGNPESSHSLIMLVKSTALDAINAGLNVDMMEFSRRALWTDKKNVFR